MRERIYPKLKPGDTVRLSADPRQKSMLRALLPHLTMCIGAFGEDAVEFVVIEVGERTSRKRHLDSCVDDGLRSSIADCECGGLTVIYDTNIWIAVEIEVVVYRQNKKGEVIAVRETRFYQSRREHGDTFTSAVTSEMLDLTYEERDVADEAAEDSPEEKQEEQQEQEA